METHVLLEYQCNAGKTTCAPAIYSDRMASQRMPEIETNLGKLRRKRGLSAIHLAATVDVSRQTIYAMEAGTYVPNTAVALRLARALEVKVEDLFTLPQAEPTGLRSEEVTLLPGSESPHPGQPVQLCRVNKRLVASPPSPVPCYFP